MAESIPQLGEIVRFAELAWRVYEIGWSGYFNAGNYVIRGPQMSPPFPPTNKSRG
jgi:hypothetical protein